MNFQPAAKPIGRVLYGCLRPEISLVPRFLAWGNPEMPRLSRVYSRLLRVYSGGTMRS